MATTPTQQNDEILKVTQKLEQASLSTLEEKKTAVDVTAVDVEADKITTEAAQVKKMSEPPAAATVASVGQQPAAAEPAPKIHSVNLNNNVKGSEKSPTILNPDLEPVSPMDLAESNNDDFIEGKYLKIKRKLKWLFVYDVTKI